MKNKERPVLILDTHRGIYFGYLKKEFPDHRTVDLVRARHCFSYTTPGDNDKGVYGLASVGPADGSRVGPQVTMRINDVAKIVDCTDAAVSRWEAAEWK